MIDDIFVFGSNLAGRHGRGAALTALQRFGAKMGQGEGLQGHSYALPTKEEPHISMKLADIKRHVDIFLAFARAHSELAFHLTPVGCGLAGYSPSQIAPMFAGAPSNVILPREFARHEPIPGDAINLRLLDTPGALPPLHERYNSMSNFSELLKKPAFVAKKPEALPAGDYPGIVTNKELGTSQQKNTPYVRYFVQLTEYPEGTDEADKTVDLSKRKLRRDFYFTDDALFRLDEFLRSCKIDGAGKAYEDLLDEVIGASVIVQVKQYMNKTSGEIQNEIGNLAGA